MKLVYFQQQKNVAIEKYFSPQAHDTTTSILELRTFDLVRQQLTEV